jgi:hypothetical protein
MKKKLSFCCHSWAKTAQNKPSNDSFLLANQLILNNLVAETAGIESAAHGAHYAKHEDPS